MIAAGLDDRLSFWVHKWTPGDRQDPGGPRRDGSPTAACLEKVTGVAAYISFGDPGPAIEAFAGRVGSGPQDAPVRQGTLFQMGSTSKSFAAGVILKLEAAGKLSIDDTLGKWLPQYPAWKDVTIQRLLNMTSGIPNYSETEAMSRIWVNDPTRELTSENLIELAYPTGSADLPRSSGYTLLVEHQLRSSPA